MKFFHLSDLHLGKRLNDYSLMEDQAYILDQIIQLVQLHHPDGVLIAGDVFDKSVPSAEAVTLFDGFLSRLQKLVPHIFIISGNHDSPERLAFGRQLMEGSGVHFSPVYQGRVEPIVLQDEFGPVKIYLLPFIKPATVRSFYPDQEIASHNAAVQVAIQDMAPDFSQRNVLVAHQFVTGARVSGAGESVVGGLDNVEAEVFQGFDYVALGHIHGEQDVDGQRVRYCGTPLHYSLSEVSHNRQTLSTGAEVSLSGQKSITLAELGPKGTLTLETLPLEPLRQVVAVRGTYDQLMNRATYHDNGLQQSYVYVTLTDEEDIPNAVGNLRTAYQKLLGLQYDNTRSRAGNHTTTAVTAAKGPLELFDALYQQGNNKPVSDEQRAYLAKIIGEIWEGEA